MTITTTALTAVSNSGAVLLKPGDSLIYSSSGTFTGQLRFARSRNGFSWETVEQPAVNVNVAGGTVKNAGQNDERYRFELTGTVTGTATVVTDTAESIGRAGEVLSASIPSASAVALATTVAKTVVALTLPAGEWDVDGVVDFIPAATTSITKLASGIHTVTDTLGGQDTFEQLSVAATVPGANETSQQTPRTRLVLPDVTKVYLIARATFTVAALTAYGSIRAKRVK